MVLTLLAGYPTPSLLGLGGAALVAAGDTSAALWVAGALLVATLVAVRNRYGVLAVLVTTALIVAVGWYLPGAGQAAFVAALAWFLLLGGLRAAHDLRTSRHPGWPSGSDAEQLVRLTGAPAGAWIALFVLFLTGNQDESHSLTRQRRSLTDGGPRAPTLGTRLHRTSSTGLVVGRGGPCSMRNHLLPRRRWVPTMSLRTATLTAAIGLSATLFAGTAMSWAAPPSQALVAGTPCTTAAKGCVDLSTLQAWLIKDGQITRGPVSISTGVAGMETPRGTFRVLRKVKDFYSTEYKAPMPYSVFFAAGGVALHEGDLDTQSAGCVHLQHDDAVAFFNALQLGDQVEVH